MRFGFFGNQPLLTRFSCSNSSRIDQKQEKDITPKMTERQMFSTRREAISVMTPADAKAHQQRVPKQYSPLMTKGWNSPMQMNETKPSIIPEKFIVNVINDRT